MLPLLRRALHGATVILLSPLLRADFGDAVTDAQIRYVANGLPDLGEIKRVPREVPRVLFLSNLLEAKGPLVLVDALTRLADRGVAFEATFAGAPTNEISESAMRAALAPFEHRVRYVGPVMGEAKQALFRDHDLFVLPTRADAFPLVLLEAMMWGLPVVSTFEGAIPDIVVDGETGCLLPGHDAELLAERLEILIRDQRLRTAMSQRARKRFVEHFTLPHFEHGLADVLSEARPR
ncbi:MAG: glycosyltransferase [Kofleriaceae bacterium]